MRLSLNITNFSWSHDPATLASDLSSVVNAADEAGVDTVWVSDHLLQADPTSGPGETEMLEAYTTLGFLAALTNRVRLGTMVTGVTFRLPALLVKAVTTLDILSSGRAWLGIGAGYQQDEARDMGLPLPPTRERFECLEETLQIVLRMWSGDESSFESAHYRLAKPVCSPPPLTKPHPPILIGGTGEQRTLRLVARYADACNLFDIPDEGATVRQKLDVLRRHCETEGRPFNAIEKTLSTRFAPEDTPDAFVERCRLASSWGIEHVVLVTRGPWTTERIRTVASTIPALQEIPT
jgi:F420-dependent oxidoreductase-like protein